MPTNILLALKAQVYMESSEDVLYSLLAGTAPLLRNKYIQLSSVSFDLYQSELGKV
jgi:hypothetical protein